MDSKGWSQPVVERCIRCGQSRVGCVCRRRMLKAAPPRPDLDAPIAKVKARPGARASAMKEASLD